MTAVGVREPRNVTLVYDTIDGVYRIYVSNRIVWGPNNVQAGVFSHDTAVTTYDEALSIAENLAGLFNVPLLNAIPQPATE